MKPTLLPRFTERKVRPPKVAEQREDDEYTFPSVGLKTRDY